MAQAMRPDGRHLDKYRKPHPVGGDSPHGALYGYFRMKVGARTLEVISSGERHFPGGVDGLGSWEHVSVSYRDYEMVRVQSLIKQTN